MTTRTFEKRYRYLRLRAEGLGLSMGVEDYAPGWRVFTFIREGDAMCVARIYDRGRKEVQAWLDGYDAAVRYPPKPSKVSWMTIRRVK